MKKLTKTNHDKIRDMSIDEMAKSLCDWVRCSECPAYDLCDISDEKDYNGFLKWLESEAEK